MGTIKTSELTGVALDWAVAKCEGFKECLVFGRGTVKDKGFAMPNKHGQDIPMLLSNTHNKWVKDCESYPWAFDQTIWRPSTDWSQGGPIIEQIKGFEFKQWLESKPELCCEAHIHNYEGNWIQFGPTPLITAMRCYVASKMGDEVEIPEELT